MTNTMKPDALATRRKYYRAWYEKHPDKRREYQTRYWEKRATREAQEKAEAKQDATVSVDK